MRKMSVILFVILLAACSKPHAAPMKTELIVSSAASLTDVMEEIEQQFEQEHPKINIIFNFGGSGKLAQQIIQGAPTDIFLSASERYMESLHDNNLLLKKSEVYFIKNELVLVANIKKKNTVNTFEDLKNHSFHLLAIGDPNSVPAGIYGKEILQHLDTWDQIQSKLVYGKDVRQVLAYVESGNADYGIVYATDATLSNKVKIVTAANETWHSPVLYPAAILKSSKQQTEARIFLDFLTSEKGQHLFNQFKFKSVEE